MCQIQLEYLKCIRKEYISFNSCILQTHRQKSWYYFCTQYLLLPLSTFAFYCETPGSRSVIAAATQRHIQSLAGCRNGATKCVQSSRQISVFDKLWRYALWCGCYLLLSMFVRWYFTDSFTTMRKSCSSQSCCWLFYCLLFIYSS